MHASYHFKCHQLNVNERGGLFHLMKRDLVCFHYHRKCQNITDNCGDNEIVLVE